MQNLLSKLLVIFLKIANPQTPTEFSVGVFIYFIRNKSNVII